MKYDRGTAGLNVLLSVIAMLFMIGLIVMVFALMSGGLAEASYSEGSGTITDETILFSDGGTDTSVASYLGIALNNVVITNSTGGTIPANNYTITGGEVTAVGSAYNGTDVNVSAGYTYDVGTGASSVITDTSSAIAGVTSWFPIVIVITAMVVLILLTVIIITAIRGSGLVASA